MHTVKALPVIVLPAVLAIAGLFPTAAPAETMQYSYDSMRRLIQVVNVDGTTIDYVYDALGNRLMKTTTLPGAPSNQPPAAVTNPNIPNSFTNVPTTASLSWSPAVDPDSGDSVVYYLYLGTSPGLLYLASSGWATNVSQGKLRGWTTYYWQVVARDSHNAQTASPVWSFTTGNEPPVADFIASSAGGWAPLAVTFTDRSFDTDNTIVSWQWDFDNNGTVDSTSRNPTFTYSAPGDYTVSLTVRDESGGANSLVRADFIRVVGSGIVDLTPLSLSIESAGSYRHLTVVYSITNHGNISLSGIWQWADACYISTDAVLAAQDPQVGVFYEYQALPASTVYLRTNVVTIPDVPAEDYYLLLKTDGNNQIGELNEADNVWVVPLTNNLPDLLASNLQAFGDTVAGQQVRVIYAVTNYGALPIDAEWYDAIYLSTNATWDTQDIRLGDLRVAAAMNLGDGYLATNDITLPTRPPGPYYLIGRTDANNWLVESNEANNSIAIPITLTAPDLVAGLMVAETNVEFYPTSPESPTVEVVWAVTNIGTGVAAGQWSDWLYVSSNAVLDDQDTFVTSSWGFGPLPAGGVYRQTNTVNLPKQSGTHWLILKADAWPSYPLYESNEENNVAVAGPITLTYEVRAPDLVAGLTVAQTNVEFYPAGPESPTVEVVWAVTNVGTVVATGQWSDWLYVSTNAVLDEQDTFVTGSWGFGPLPAGGVYRQTNTVNLPKQSGTYWLILKADAWPSYPLFESNEENNVAVAGPVSLTYEERVPDLVAGLTVAQTNVEFYPPGPESPTVEVMWAVTNIGTGVAAGQWSDWLYVSTNAVLDEQDIFVTGSWGFGPLPAGGVYRQTNTVNLPKQSGTYWLILKADAWPSYPLYESNEENNVAVAGPVTVVPQYPDLAAINLTWIGEPVAGQALTLVWTVANSSSAIAQPSWCDAVYFSTNVILDGPDTGLRSQSRSLALAAGSSYQVTNTVTIPANAPLSYYLILKADDQNAVVEANETNNWRAFGVGQYRDSDGDGVPDWWEQQYFGSLVRDGTRDFDGDGFSDAGEYVADTNPTNTLSVLRISQIVPQANGLRIEWQGGVQARQYLERSTGVDSAGITWLSIHTNTPPTPFQTNLVDQLNTNHTLFYRIRAARE